jgi:hypothetical protein
MTDTIRLTVPAGRAYQGVVNLVVGGVAARSGLSVDALEDVQLALDALLADGLHPVPASLDIEIGLEARGLVLTVGPLDRALLDAALDDGAGSVGLARLLGSTTSGYEIEGDDSTAQVRLSKGAGGDKE